MEISTDHTKVVNGPWVGKSRFITHATLSTPRHGIGNALNNTRLNWLVTRRCASICKEALRGRKTGRCLAHTNRSVDLFFQTHSLHRDTAMAPTRSHFSLYPDTYRNLTPSLQLWGSISVTILEAHDPYFMVQLRFQLRQRITELINNSRHYLQANVEP
jgi:hypothetical protein